MAQTLLHIQTMWRTLTNDDAQATPQASYITISGGWTQVSVLAKSFPQITFLRPGADRETSFLGEHKEVSGKLHRPLGSGERSCPEWSADAGTLGFALLSRAGTQLHLRPCLSDWVSVSGDESTAHNGEPHSDESPAGGLRRPPNSAHIVEEVILMVTPWTTHSSE